jgi:hypothetical protein
VCFDVEDLVHPGSDDAPLEIADTLADCGIVASMCVVGEKARLLERRGRRDVIASLGKHDVSLHTDRHSMHPTVSEYLAEKGWADGVEEAYRRESPGARDLARIFGAFPSTWGTSGSSWGPQIPAATRQIGVPSNVYSHVSLGKDGAWWFAGQLCYAIGLLLRGAEDACCDDGRFEAALPELLREMEGLARAGAACVLLFGGHPTRFRHMVFWDVLNYSAGCNTEPEDYRWAPRRDDDAYATGLRNTRRMVLAVRDVPGVRITSVRALNGRFAPESGPIAWGGLARLAEAAADGGNIGVNDPTASPAQVLDLLCRAQLQAASGAAAPDFVLSRTVLGPAEACQPLTKRIAIGAPEATSICRTIANHVGATGHLPTSVDVAGTFVGPGPLLVSFARRYLKLNAGENLPELTLGPGPEEPTIAARLAEEQIYQSLPGWPPHPPDLRLDRLALHLRLQSWSLKPAVLADS